MRKSKNPKDPNLPEEEAKERERIEAFTLADSFFDAMTEAGLWEDRDPPRKVRHLYSPDELAERIRVGRHASPAFRLVQWICEEGYKEGIGPIDAFKEHHERLNDLEKAIETMKPIVEGKEGERLSFRQTWNVASFEASLQSNLGEVPRGTPPPEIQRIMKGKSRKPGKQLEKEAHSLIAFSLNQWPELSERVEKIVEAFHALNQAVKEHKDDLDRWKTEHVDCADPIKRCSPAVVLSLVGPLLVCSSPADPSCRDDGVSRIVNDWIEKNADRLDSGKMLQLPRNHDQYRESLRIRKYELRNILKSPDPQSYRVLVERLRKDAIEIPGLQQAVTIDPL